LSYAQAITSSFKTALMKAIASTVGVNVDDVSLVNYVINQYRHLSHTTGWNNSLSLMSNTIRNGIINHRIQLSQNSTRLSYSISVISSISDADLTSILDSAVSSGSFASSLSSYSGIPGLGVTGSVSDVTSSPVGAPTGKPVTPVCPPLNSK
jgi:hypothetical protein